MIYDEVQKIATDVLTEFDQGEIYYVELVPGNGPADDPGPAVLTRHKVRGVARGVKFKYIQNGTAIASDMQTVFAVSDKFTPDMSGFIDIGASRYKVVQVMPIPPAGVTVAHRVIFGKR